MKILRSLDMLHPVLTSCVSRIQNEVINKHNIPIRLFETGREHDRHQTLLQRSKTQDVYSRHLFDLENDPPLYATAVDYVYYDKRWSWNLRDQTITSWYILFGNLVLDTCPELTWGGKNRKSTNFNHFALRDGVIAEFMDKYPCTVI